MCSVIYINIKTKNTQKTNKINKKNTKNNQSNNQTNKETVEHIGMQNIKHKKTKHVNMNSVILVNSFGMFRLQNISNHSER